MFDLAAHRHAWWAPGKCLELRRRLAPAVASPSATRDLQLLDIALESWLRLLIERTDRCAAAVGVACLFRGGGCFVGEVVGGGGGGVWWCCVKIAVMEASHHHSPPHTHTQHTPTARASLRTTWWSCWRWCCRTPPSR